MRKIALIVALALVPFAALAQFYLRPNLPPMTIIGNPYSINAPAQAIPFVALSGDLIGNLLTPVIPSLIDLNNLPPQTVIGNGTGVAAPLGVITFSQLKALQSQSNLPNITYHTYDPSNVPPYTIIGNSSTTATLSIPVPISLAFFFVFGCSQLFLTLSNSCAVVTVTNMGF